MEVISVKREKCWRQNEEEEEKNAWRNLRLLQWWKLQVAVRPTYIKLRWQLCKRIVWWRFLEIEWRIWSIESCED